MPYQIWHGAHCKQIKGQEPVAHMQTIPRTFYTGPTGDFTSTRNTGRLCTHIKKPCHIVALICFSGRANGSGTPASQQHHSDSVGVRCKLKTWSQQAKQGSSGCLSLNISTCMLATAQSPCHQPCALGLQGGHWQLKHCKPATMGHA